MRAAGANTGVKGEAAKPATLASIGKGASSLPARRSPRVLFARLGGMLAHAGLAVILAGLVGSSMYVTDKSGYLSSGGEDSQAAAEMQVGSYTVSAGEATIEDKGDGYLYQLELQVQAADGSTFTLAPSIYLDAATSQQKYDAAVASRIDHDLFAVYRGVNENGDYSVELRINPLISFVWAGFFLLMAGTALGLFAKRGVRGAGSAKPRDARKEAGAAPADGQDAQPKPDGASS